VSRLGGKVALVTGAAQGIGRAIAEVFAAHGATVVATDIREPGEPHPSPVEFARLDVAAEADWSRVVADVAARHGHLDVLVNNAGIATLETIAELELASWHAVIDVTLGGAFLGMREVIPHMRARGGSVINISSIWGTTAVPLAASYHAAKGGVRTLTKNAAVTYGADRIRVNSVHPGFVDTPATRAQPAALSKAVIEATPLGRAADPREIANACLFLASDESSFVTGAELAVDGGYLAR
jgi:NAD(P)-dependent dehydrogenase (short-subunit alcohol dehydrogenase family)